MSQYDSQTIPNLLHVVMHGSICLVDIGKDGFIAYLLEMGSEHSYLYGDWLTENEFPHRELDGDPVQAQLINVPTGQDSLKSSTNAIVTIKKAPSVTDPYARAIIRLPRPDAIYDCQSEPLDKQSIQGNGLVIHPKMLSDTRVFQYKFTDPTQFSRVSLAFDNGEHWICPVFI